MVNESIAIAVNVTLRRFIDDVNNMQTVGQSDASVCLSRASARLMRMPAGACISVNKHCWQYNNATIRYTKNRSKLCSPRMRKHRVGIHDLAQRQVSLDLVANISFRTGRCQPASFSCLAKAFVSSTFQRLLCSSFFLNRFTNLLESSIFHLLLFPRICSSLSKQVFLSS